MVEYAQKIETFLVRDVNFPYNQELFNNASNVICFARPFLKNSDVEKMLVLYLNPKNALVCLHQQIGTVDYCAIYLREVIKYALLSGASSIVMVHNHPSGDTTPSKEDFKLTEAVEAGCKLMGITFLDHIIIGKDDSYSFNKSGLV